MSTIDAAIAYNAARPYQLPHWQAIQVSVGTTPDGIPGRLTAEAVAHWQAGRGLAVDGKVGPDTLKAMHLEYVHGIDVYHKEGAIDWRKVALDPLDIRFAFIKATQGTTHVDSRLEVNAVGAHQAGLRVGYYHFLHTEGQSGRGNALAQAEHFLEQIRHLPPPTMPLVLDIEQETPLSRENYTAVCETWMAAVAGFCEGKCWRAGVIVYTSKRIVDRDLLADHLLGQYESEYDLWAPRYGSNPPEHPTGWDRWSIWQCADDARVSGISSDVDLNRADPTWWAALETGYGGA